MRQVKYGDVNGRIGENRKNVTWHRGRRSVSTYKVRANKKSGEVYSVYTQRSFNVGGMLSIIAILLLIAGIISNLTGSSDKSFYSFLYMLQTIPEVFPLHGMVEYFQLQDFSNLPNWLEGIIEFGSGLFQIIAFLVKGILSAISLIFHILRWLFI